MAMPGKTLKWVLMIVAVVGAAAVFGYVKFFFLNPERQMVAKINGQKITVAQFDRELAKVPASYQEVFREEPRQFLDQLMIREILLQEATRQGLKSDPSLQREEAIANLIQSLLKKEVMDKISVSREEIENLLLKNNR